jgi:hypothetical protein
MHPLSSRPQQSRPRPVSSTTFAPPHYLTAADAFPLIHRWRNDGKTLDVDGLASKEGRPKKRSKTVVTLLTEDFPCTHRRILDTLYTLNFDPKSDEPKVLPVDLVSRVCSYLTVEPVQARQVRAQCASSHDWFHPLSESLTDLESTWWLSRSGTMPSGRGREYVQYSLTPTLCRLREVSIKIPTLPQAPLSVRSFRLERFSIDRGWHPCSPDYQVANQSGWQTFALPGKGCDVDEVRVVCLRNQMAEFLCVVDASTIRTQRLREDMGRFTKVGFFGIRFE